MIMPVGCIDLGLIVSSVEYQAAHSPLNIGFELSIYDTRVITCYMIHITYM